MASQKEGLGAQLRKIAKEESLQKIAAARMPNDGEDFKTISELGLKSLKKDKKFLEALLNVGKILNEGG